VAIVEHSIVKKNKVLLSDYNYMRDIENRLLLSRFTEVDYAALEEILYSPIRIPLSKIAENIDLSENETFRILQKFASTGLVAFEEDLTVVVDKETRKYFEVEAEKFEESFQPGMEFLQHLLKKVSIHVLPQWYAIPRTSDNIFESIVERYLETPQVFQRHLLDLNFQDPTLLAIAQDVIKSPQFEIDAEEIQRKYNLTSEQFQEVILNLEFHFICTVIYRKEGNHWKEIVTLFQEWKEHLFFLKETTPTISIDSEKIQRYRPSDFSFVDDMATLLKEQSLECTDEYKEKLHLKIEQLGLTHPESSLEWLTLSSEERALYIHRHPSNYSSTQEKNIREIEKFLGCILYLGWTSLSEFLASIHIPLNDGQPVTLCKTGEHWKYQRPNYTPEEIELIQSILSGHLFESGIIALGTLNAEPCICVTSFGQSLLG
jgi:predicted transcriptional regulator